MVPPFSSYDALINAFINNRLAPEQVEPFFQFLEQSGFREKYGDRIDMDLLDQAFSGWSDSQQADRVYERIARKASLPSSLEPEDAVYIMPPAVKTRSLGKYVFRWAAVLILAGAAATLYYYNYVAKHTKGITSVKPATEVKGDVLPGSDKAILTLASGKQVALGNSSGLINEEGLSIQQQDGSIAYHDSKVLAINTMTTPIGGQYQLTLADGTKVWLNAASSISFPTSFPGKSREVEITGEVYFEVTKNAAQPFIVRFNNQKVEVLGTTFNINAYPEEIANTTTLVEGAVRISRDKQQLVLRPNEQAVANNNLTINQSADISQVLAWKNGTFNFNGQDFAASMRQLERWYEIEVVYDGNKPTEKLGGEIDRNMTLNQALKVLNGIVANFRLEGKVLHVLPMP